MNVLRQELNEKLSKMQVEIESIRTSNIDNESKANQYEKAVASYRTQLAESQEANQEEIRQKLALQSRLRSNEDECNNLREQLEDKGEKEDKMSMQVKQLNDQTSFNA